MHQSKSQKISYQFAPLPVTAVSDASLSDGAFRAYAALLAIRNGDIARISNRTLAKDWLYCAERTAFSYVHELISAGYIEPINAKNGRCGEYRISSLTAANTFSALELSGDRALQSAEATTANSFSGTAANRFSVSRGKKLSRVHDDEKSNDEERYQRDRVHLLQLLAQAAMGNGNEAARADANLEREADRLLRRHTHVYERNRLFAHLQRAIADANLIGLAAKVAWAKWQTQYGADAAPVGAAA